MTTLPASTANHPRSAAGTQNLKVREAARGLPPAVTPECCVQAACQILRDAGATEALVTRSGESDGPVRDLLGIITHSDLVAVLAEDPRPGELPVTQVMQSRVHTIDANESLDRALFDLQRLRIHRLPVTVDGKLQGLLTIESLLEARSRELDLLRQTNESLKSAATHDPLTHLANRRLFDEALPREIARARRTGRDLGLLMIDIDHFKQVNDTFGHQRGDLVLQEISARLLSTVRRADLLARFGGEEFVVLASVPGEDALLTLAEKLRLRVQVRPFSDLPQLSVPPRASRIPQPSASEALRVTISLGAALLSATMATPDDLIAAADDALYEAKAAGRNCVRLSAGPLNDRG